MRWPQSLRALDVDDRARSCTSNAVRSARPPGMRVLLSNDDGIDAPGLRAVAAAVSALSGVVLCVSAPESERSATGHGITISGPVFATARSVPGAVEAYAVSGSPADCAMLALTAPAFFASGCVFDVCLSGVNKGNNSGLHVHYSGTVAAAREAAIKHVPSIALSLDDYREEADYTAAAQATALLVRVLQSEPALLAHLRGVVLNVNVPKGALAELRGFALTSQSLECTLPGWVAVECDGSRRGWRNGFGGTHKDHRAGGDTAAMADGLVSVSVLGLVSSLPTHSPAVPPHSPAAIPPGCNEAGARAVLHAAAAIARLAAGRLAAAPAEC